VRRCLCGKVGCARHGSSSGWAAYKRRHPERAAFYASSSWRVMRDHHLKANPTCVVCGEPAGHADHVLAIANGGTTEGQLQSMCAKHHHDKTVRDSHKGGQAPSRSTEESPVRLRSLLPTAVMPRP
jgi:5-methylcytosine-specific restriction endonuclease McrA